MTAAFSTRAGTVLNAPYWHEDYSGDDPKECVQFYESRMADKELLTDACAQVDNDGGDEDSLPTPARNVWDRAVNTMEGGRPAEGSSRPPRGFLSRLKSEMDKVPGLNYDPSQPRSSDGRFGTTGTGSSEKESGDRRSHDSRRLTSTLSQTPVSSKTDLNAGYMDSFVVTLEDGTKGIWKPRSGEKHVRNNIDVGTYYHREAAASAVAEAIGLGDLVPPTVAREIDGEVGSLQHWEDDAVGPLDVPEGKGYDGPRDLARTAAFDYLIGHADRHWGNWMINHPGKPDEKLVLIDNGLSFPRNNDSNIQSMPAERAASDELTVPEDVKDWDWKDINKAMLDNDIEDDAREVVRGRLKELKANIGKPLRRLSKMET